MRVDKMRCLYKPPNRRHRIYWRGQVLQCTETAAEKKRGFVRRLSTGEKLTMLNSGGAQGSPHLVAYPSPGLRYIL